MLGFIAFTFFSPIKSGSPHCELVGVGLIPEAGHPVVANMWNQRLFAAPPLKTAVVTPVPRKIPEGRRFELPGSGKPKLMLLLNTTFAPPAAQFVCPDACEHSMSY